MLGTWFATLEAWTPDTEMGDDALQHRHVRLMVSGENVREAAANAMSRFDTETLDGDLDVAFEFKLQLKAQGGHGP